MDRRLISLGRHAFDGKPRVTTRSAVRGLFRRSKRQLHALSPSSQLHVAKCPARIVTVMSPATDSPVHPNVRMKFPHRVVLATTGGLSSGLITDPRRSNVAQFVASVNRISGRRAYRACLFFVVTLFVHRSRKRSSSHLQAQTSLFNE